MLMIYLHAFTLYVHLIFKYIRSDPVPRMKWKYYYYYILCECIYFCVCLCNSKISQTLQGKITLQLSRYSQAYSSNDERRNTHNRTFQSNTFHLTSGTLITCHFLQRLKLLGIHISVSICIQVHMYHCMLPSF